MPIYEYQCEACGDRTEVLQKMSDAPKLECLACGESALKKKVSAVAFRLKGSGWYETDFKTGDKKNLAGDSAGKNNAAGKDDKPAAPKEAVKSSANTSKAEPAKSGTA
jgi:putative FmdB family regulatory protein